MVLPLFYGADRNRHGSESAVPEFYEYSPSEDEISTSREANNARLRKAISYLADEGGDDDPSLYLDRVQQIDDYLKQYRSQGFAYDTKLYRNARAMIREIQRDVQLVAEEESSVDFGESDASVEVIPTEALYREEDDEDEMFSGVPGTPHQKQQHMPTPPDTSSRKVKSARTSQHTKSRRPTTPSQVDILEKVHLYGGPGNPKELWHRDFPAILPFGENLFMQEWESQKIHYDLTQSAKKKLGDKDAVVTTNVPYNFVSDKFLPRQFESGSRFKLPPLAAYQRLISDSKLEGFFPVQTAINEFNQGGIPKSQGRIQAENDYVPRIFLKQANNKLVAPFKRMSDKAKGKRALQDARSIGHPSGYSRQAGFSATSRNHAQSLDQSESKTAPGPSKTAKQSRVGTAGPGVQYHVRNVLEKSAKAQGSAPVYEDEWSDSYSSDFDFSSDEDFVPSGLNGYDLKEQLSQDYPHTPKASQPNREYPPTPKAPRKRKRPFSRTSPRANSLPKELVSPSPAGPRKPLRASGVISASSASKTDRSTPSPSSKLRKMDEKKAQAALNLGKTTSGDSASRPAVVYSGRGRPPKGSTRSPSATRASDARGTQLPPKRKLFTEELEARRRLEEESNTVAKKRKVGFAATEAPPAWKQTAQVQKPKSVLKKGVKNMLDAGYGLRNRQVQVW